MTTSTGAFDFLPHLNAGSLAPETAPWIKWGQGTPDGDADPWLSAQKGSVYIQVDASDDASPIFIKVDEGGDDADWDNLPLSTHTHA